MLSPVFIIGPPRSATTALAELLALHPEVSMWTHEAHRFHHDLARFSHRVRGEDHYWLTAADVTDALCREYRDAVAGLSGLPVIKVSTASIQIDFIRAIFPKARFVQILREPLDVIASMEDLRRALEADQDHPRLLGPAPDPYGLSVASTFDHLHLRAAAAWFFHAVRSELDLRFAGADHFHRLSYKELLVSPEATVEHLLAFLGLLWDDAIGPGVAALETKPGGPASLGFSTTETRSSSRIDRYASAIGPDFVHAVAPLLEVPAGLWGFDYGDVPPEEAWAAACAHEHIPAEPWIDWVREVVDQASRELEAFDPLTFLRQSDYLEFDSRLMLASGSATGLSFVQGESTPTTTVCKQHRSYRFHDPHGAIAALLPSLDGRLDWGAVCDALPDPEHTRQVLERLHGLALVAFL